MAIEFIGLTPDKDFAKEFSIAWLQGRKILVNFNRDDLDGEGE